MKIRCLSLLLACTLCGAQTHKTPETSPKKNLSDSFAKAAMRAVIAMDLNNEGPNTRSIVKDLISESNIEAQSPEEMQAVQDLNTLWDPRLSGWDVKHTDAEVDLAIKRDHACQVDMIASLRARIYKTLPAFCLVNR